MGYPSPQRAVGGRATLSHTDFPRKAVYQWLAPSFRKVVEYNGGRFHQLTSEDRGLIQSNVYGVMVETFIDIVKQRLILARAEPPIDGITTAYYCKYHEQCTDAWRCQRWMLLARQLLHPEPSLALEMYTAANVLGSFDLTGMAKSCKDAAILLARAGDGFRKEHNIIQLGVANLQMLLLFPDYQQPTP